MSEQRTRSWRPLYTVIGVVAATAGWITLLWPPVKFYYNQPKGGLLATVRELLTPQNAIYDDGIFIGYIFIISSALLAITLPLAIAQMLSRITRYVERSEADVSLLQLELTLRFDKFLHSCTIVRQQLFHANQPNTSAYHYNQSVDADGAVIDADSFEMNSRIANERITSDYIIRSHPKKFEAIEVFKRPLPTSWLATYLPDWIVLFIYEHTAILDKSIVERVGEIIITGDHDGEQPVFELHSPKRRARNITITLDFPSATAPRPADIKCFVIRDNVVSAIYPRCNPIGDRRVYTAFVSELDHEKIRFQWNNQRLFAVKSGDLASDAVLLNQIDEPSMPLRKRRWYGSILNLAGNISSRSKTTPLASEESAMSSTDKV